MKKLNKKLAELKAEETTLYSNLENISFAPNYEYFNVDLDNVNFELRVIKEKIRTLIEARSILNEDS
jgi:hypothetical protein